LPFPLFAGEVSPTQGGGMGCVRELLAEDNSLVESLFYLKIHSFVKNLQWE